MRYLVHFVPEFLSVGVIWFLLLHRDAVLMSSRFFLTANISQGTLCFVLGVVGMHSAAASLWALTKFS